MNELPIIRARSRAEIRPAHRCPGRFIRSPRSPAPDAPPFTWTSRLSGERLPVDRIDQVGGASLKSERVVPITTELFQG